MSELGNVLRMLYILKNRRKVKGAELAEELEIDIRQVRRYKRELMEYFDIEATSGPDGGYVLKDQYFPFKEILTKKEVSNLKRAIDTIGYQDTTGLSKAIDKINFTILNSSNESLICEQIIPYSRPRISSEEINKIYNDMSLAILSCKEIIIKYIDNKGILTRRIIQPHKILNFKGEYYLVSTCTFKNEIRYFKLVRIKEYILTDKKFEKKLDIDKILDESRKNSIGIFSGEIIRLELEIAPPMANTIKERIWVENQEIIELEDGKIILKADMKEGPELISWVLSMGDTVKINSPESLKSEIKKKIQNILKKYN
ncbi:helix-turn-helix transcriptional regulator [Clostridium gasigenes]|uniref:WYL domain-containing protein n=1 Tax=Clostridium gasigenes TaxID=94869 RepID=A0A7X0VQ10_9CLOT|nr:WYL domain-containing protein [Clostridium gasigenes]MBB6713834.1 WYL domain-containing protein [Clostridium gasigenes]